MRQCTNLYRMCMRDQVFSVCTQISIGFSIQYLNIGFTSSIYTVSEDESVVDLTIINGDAASATDNITLHIHTSDWTAKGTCMCTRCKMLAV